MKKNPLLIFERTYFGDVHIEETGRVIKRAKLYLITKDGGHVAKFYSGENFSFAEFDDQKIRIDYYPQTLGGLKYTLFDQYTNVELCLYKIPNTDWLYRVDSYFILHTLERFKISQNTDHRKLFKKNSLRMYRFDAISEKTKIVYYGEMLPNIFPGFLIKNQIFKGEIQCNIETSLSAIIAGLHVVEEDFRRQEKAGT